MPLSDAQKAQRTSILLHYTAMAVNAASLVGGILLVFFGGEAGEVWVRRGIIIVAGGTLAFLILEGIAVQFDRRVVEQTGPNVPQPPQAPRSITLEKAEFQIHY